MDIILVRHGESYNNIKKVYGGDYTKLTDNGRKQIEETRKKVENLDFKTVYYSPLKRTKETLDILGLKGYAREELIEYNFGIFNNHTYNEIRKKYPDETKKWVEDPFNYRIPGGDSIKALYKRTLSFLDEIVAADESVLLVSHAGIIQLILSWVFDDYRYIYKFKVDNGSISIVTIEDNYKYISKLNY